MENYLNNTNYSLLSDIFYQNDNVTSVAQGLLGKIIMTQIDGNLSTAMIVETEAYAGIYDRGCHSFNGRRTPRTEIMYALGGLSYVYICYGMHPMINVVTGSLGDPTAVLIRAVEPLQGIEIMYQRRNIKTINHSLTNGPAKTAVALGIEKNHNGVRLNHEASPIQIFEYKNNIEAPILVKTARIGMSHHVGKDAHLRYRYYIKGNPWVSKPLNPSYDF